MLYNCNLVDFVGIPCCHIIAFYGLMFAEFLTYLIDPRWKNGNFSINHNEEIIFNHDDIVFKFKDENSNENIEPEFHNNENGNHDHFDGQQYLPSAICNDTYDSNSFSVLSESERYVCLFHNTKPIWSLASKNPDTS